QKLWRMLLACPTIPKLFALSLDLTSASPHRQFAVTLWREQLCAPLTCFMGCFWSPCYPSSVSHRTIRGRLREPSGRESHSKVRLCAKTPSHLNSVATRSSCTAWKHKHIRAPIH